MQPERGVMSRQRPPRIQNCRHMRRQVTTVVAARPESQTQVHHVMSFVPCGMSGTKLGEGFQTKYAKIVWLRQLVIGYNCVLLRKRGLTPVMFGAALVAVRGMFECRG